MKRRGSVCEPRAPTDKRCMRACFDRQSTQAALKSELSRVGREMRARMKEAVITLQAYLRVSLSYRSA